MVGDVNKANPGTIVELKAAIRKSWLARTHNPAFMEATVGGWRKRVEEMVALGGETVPF